MSAMKVRKNNVGRAIIRFLIGAIILAVLVLVFQTVILNKKRDVNVNTDGEPLINALVDAEPTEKPVDDFFPDEIGNEGNDELIDIEPTDKPTTPDEGEEIIATPIEAEVTAEPTPEPTPEPTATPVPTPSPVPATSYNAISTKAKDYPWKTDRDTRVKNGVTEITIGASENGGNVISMTAFCYGNWEGFNGNEATNFVQVTDQNKRSQYYTTTVAAGATGIAHSVKHGKNMDKADYTCVIDVSSYPDGTYTLGSCVRFKVSGSWYSFGYTFGEPYVFTVVGGYVTAMGGVEN